MKTNVAATVIAEGSELEGKLTFSGTATVNGKVRGEIVSTGCLIVGEKAVVNASIRAGVVHIAGEVVGDVTAAERLELHARCRVYGDVESPIVVIEEGALLEGQCRMDKKAGETPDNVSRDPDVVPFKRQDRPR